MQIFILLCKALLITLCLKFAISIQLPCLRLVSKTVFYEHPSCLFYLVIIPNHEKIPTFLGFPLHD